MSDTIKLQNAGPVESLTVPVQDEGCIIIIRGMNDCGKSESLKAFSRLLGSNEKIRKRYGSKRGFVEGLGARIDLMANARESGQCEAVSLEGSLDIGDLIDPGLKDPVAADKARIKALLTVRGVKAEINRFCPLVEFNKGDMTNWVSDGTLAATDLVDMAARLKKDFEKESRSLADYAKTADAGARAKRESADGLDLEAESDGEKLQGLLEAAITQEARTLTTRVGQVTAANKRDTAKRNLAEAEAGYKGPTLEEAEKEGGKIAELQDAAMTEVKAHRKALEAAVAEESRLETAYEICREKRKAASQHREAMAGWHETIESAANVKEVSNEELSEAVASVKKAREAVEHGVRIRDAQKALAEAEDLQGDANTLQTQADQLRDAAKGTTDVLAEAVQAGTLIPVTDDHGNFRFAVKSEHGDDRRTYYHDLGPGIRTAIAIKETASCLRALDPGALKLALVVLPQPMWEGLDWEQREHVWKHVRQLGVNLITGECDKDKASTGGIRAEVFEPVP